jgi:hypothetical protein
MKPILIRALCAVTGLLLLLGDIDLDAPMFVVPGRSANALVGAPLTPFSGAGVARRTTRRVIAAEAATAPPQQVVVVQPPAGTAMAIGTVVATLPGGCTSLRTGGVEYRRCGEDYYRAAFQGDSLVYVVVPRP